MGKVSGARTVLVATLVAMLGGAAPALSQEKAGADMRNMSIASVDFLLGREVRNPEGEVLANVGGVLFEGNRVAYLILQVSGQGNTWRQVPVPASMARLRESDNAIVVDIEKRRLTDAPSYSAQKRPDFSDPDWEQQIHSYYGERSPDRALNSYILIGR